MKYEIELPGPELPGHRYSFLRFAGSPQWQDAEPEDAVRAGWIDCHPTRAWACRSNGSGIREVWLPIDVDMAIILAVLADGADPHSTDDCQRMAERIGDLLRDAATQETQENPQ